MVFFPSKNILMTSSEDINNYVRCGGSFCDLCTSWVQKKMSNPIMDNGNRRDFMFWNDAWDEYGENWVQHLNCGEIRIFLLPLGADEADYPWD